MCLETRTNHIEVAQVTVELLYSLFCNYDEGTFIPFYHTLRVGMQDEKVIVLLDARPLFCRVSNELYV